MLLMGSDSHCEGFAPWVDEEATHLVLGSMPSVASLAAGQYYAFRQNRFWPLMFHLLAGTDNVPEDYNERLALLRAHHVALWAAIGTCEREGSLDTAIHDETGNDFTAFLAQYPRIRTICFNGGKSFAAFKKYNKPLLSRPDLTFHQMPSTSPANARWRFPMLVERWGEVFRGL